jgi:CubicO group peptidase (beta-lactamase class C family)
MTSRTFSPAVLAVLGATLLASGLLAQAPGQPPLVSPPDRPKPAVLPSEPRGATTGLKDPAELEAFLDGVIAAQKESNHTEGVTIAVVANGGLFFAKGYGMADRAAARKVDPERTLFRVGSVSKLFTWTAVMQLVEQGKLDLKADVNRYLDGAPFTVPATFQQPITLAHLMTHTPGFEDVVVGLFARSPADMRPLGALLADELPLRVRPPGVWGSYSNHGTALAGYVVERVSNTPYEQYVEQHILDPLGMRHTTVRQPIPAALKPDMSVGYRFVGGEQKAQEFEFVPASPAGAISASAVDMTHFMLAHLQDGRYGDARILAETTARSMHARAFGASPDLNGMMLGFYEMNRNGHRVYGHGGDTLWFHTDLALLPDDGVGLFVSYNGDTGARPRSALVNAFLDRYFPAASTPAPGTAMREPRGTVAGSYRSLRRSYRSLAKVVSLLSSVTVEELPDGRLKTSGTGPEPLYWKEVAPLVFRRIDRADRIAFRIDDRGRVTHAVGDFPAITLERVGTFESPGFLYAVLAGSVGVLAWAFVAWPVVAWRARRNRPSTAPPRAARLVLWLAAALLLAFGVGMLLALDDPMEAVFGVSNSLKAILALPLIAAVLTVVAFVFSVNAWRKRYWRASGRIGYTLVLAAAVALLAWLNYFNLLGYHLK